MFPVLNSWGHHIDDFCVCDNLVTAHAVTPRLQVMVLIQEGMEEIEVNGLVMAERQ